MEFFGMGFGEILLVVVIALLIFGPGKIVEVARTIGKITRTVKKSTADFTAAVTEELNKAEKEILLDSKTGSANKIQEPRRKDGVEPGDTEKTGQKL